MRSPRLTWRRLQPAVAHENPPVPPRRAGDPDITTVNPAAKRALARPNGGSEIVSFNTPTPGAPNPLVSGPPPFGGALVINEVLASNAGAIQVVDLRSNWPYLGDFRTAGRIVQAAAAGLGDRAEQQLVVAVTDPERRREDAPLEQRARAVRRFYGQRLERSNARPSRRSSGCRSPT